MYVQQAGYPPPPPPSLSYPPLPPLLSPSTTILFSILGYLSRNLSPVAPWVKQIIVFFAMPPATKRSPWYVKITQQPDGFAFDQSGNIERISVPEQAGRARAHIRTGKSSDVSCCKAVGCAHYRTCAMLGGRKYDLDTTGDRWVPCSPQKRSILCCTTVGNSLTARMGHLAMQ